MTLADTLHKCSDKTLSQWRSQVHMSTVAKFGNSPLRFSRCHNNRSSVRAITGSIHEVYADKISRSTRWKHGK